jgi:hypothetical protein
MLLDWFSFLAYPNLFGIKGFFVVVVVVVVEQIFLYLELQYQISISSFLAKTS